MILKLQIVTFFVWTKMLETAMEKELIHKAKKKNGIYMHCIWEWKYIYEYDEEYGRHGGGLLMQYWMPGSCSFTGCGWTSSGFLLPPPPTVLLPPPPVLPPPPLPPLLLPPPPPWAISLWESSVTKEGKQRRGLWGKER